ncbi:hypothetical protein B7463_g3451, partial [Scytalidium lignicola]
MQSISSSTDYSNISVSGLREPLQLAARLPLDLSWTRAASDSALSRAYPSPPMSGSPPRPPSHNPDSSEIGYGGYGSTGQDMFRGNHTPQSERSDNSMASMRPYQQETHPPQSYSSLSMGDVQSAQYQVQQRAHMPPERHSYAPHSEQVPAGYSTSDRAAIGEPTGYPSPKAQRKTKGHVASACVPCKRAHLREVGLPSCSDNVVAILVLPKCVPEFANVPAGARAVGGGVKIMGFGFSARATPGKGDRPQRPKALSQRGGRPDWRDRTSLWLALTENPEGDDARSARDLQLTEQQDTGVLLQYTAGLRPCSRCMSNGKEDTCVDVQHKKRGRPRLRDEREPRYEGSGYPPGPSDASMRRPLSLYSVNEAQMQQGFADGQGSGPYRVLKSQGGGPIVPRYFDQASPGDTGMYSAPGTVASNARPLSGREPALAYLTMDLQIAKSTPAFGQALGGQSVVGRPFHDLVSPADRDKAFRLQRVFEDERREREPSYLPPIYLKFEEDRVIQSVGFGPEDVAQFRTDRPEVFTFQGPDGQQRTFQVHFGLAKKESTYFVVLVLHVPATPQAYHQPVPSPFSRDPYSREPQYGYQTAQQVYPPNPGVSPYIPSQSYADPRGEVMAYRAPPTLGSNVSPSAGPSSFAQSQGQPRMDYSQSQAPYQPGRNEATSAQAQIQHDLQLPPIRDQRGEEVLGDPSRRRDDRPGRLDIGGLLETPDHSSRRQ